MDKTAKICNLFKCAPKIKEVKDIKVIWDHTCPINKRNCWVSEHEIYNVWDDIYNLFVDRKITKIFQDILKTNLFKKYTVYIPQRKRNNTTECQDIIIKIGLDNGHQIGHFSLHSKLPNYYNKKVDKKIYSGCGYYQKKRGDTDEVLFIINHMIII